jgi:hypothetical protein
VGEVFFTRALTFSYNEAARVFVLYQPSPY